MYNRNYLDILFIYYYLLITLFINLQNENFILKNQNYVIETQTKDDILQLKERVIYTYM